jgi:hypothetical protein
MHFGYENPGYVYTMNGQQLGTTSEERDNGVIVIKSLKPTAQCNSGIDISL